MSNPFADLEQYLVNATGMDALLSGAVLAIGFTIPIILMFAWFLDPKGENPMPGIFIGGGIGIAFSTIVGWLDLWVVFFIVAVIVFLMVDPLKLMKRADAA